MYHTLIINLVDQLSLVLLMAASRAHFATVYIYLHLPLEFEKHHLQSSTVKNIDCYGPNVLTQAVIHTPSPLGTHNAPYPNNLP